MLGDLLQFGAVVFRLNHEQRTCVSSTTSSEDMGDLALAIAQFDKLIEDQVVVPHYQPIVTAGGLIVGFEALARSRLFGLDNPKMMFKAAEFFQKEAQLSRMLRTEALRRSGSGQRSALVSEYASGRALGSEAPDRFDAADSPGESGAGDHAGGARGLRGRCGDDQGSAPGA